MTSRDFVYWLQGYFEIEKERAGVLGPMGAEQVECIAKHLALVFKHEIDPSAGDAKHQADLNAIHDAPKPPPWPQKPFGDIGPDGKVYRC